MNSQKIKQKVLNRIEKQTKWRTFFETNSKVNILNKAIDLTIQECKKEFEEEILYLKKRLEHEEATAKRLYSELQNKGFRKSSKKTINTIRQQERQKLLQKIEEKIKTLKKGCGCIRDFRSDGTKLYCKPPHYCADCEIKLELLQQLKEELK